MEMVLSLAEIGTVQSAAVGGKAVNLGIMIGAGLPVPGGFCVTTHGYRAVVGDTLAPAITDLGAVPAGALGERARRLRDQIVGLPVPPDLAAAVLDAYAALGDDVPVAVRSSATAEDLAYASFAGQQDTYLNVVGPAAVLDAVRRCWASLWTERAIAYRQANGVDQDTVALAVVVQRMVDAVAAGVMFTANPVTGTRHETVIDASPGLGEAVVSGLVNPDHFVVDARTGTLVQQQVGDKRVLITSVAGGGTQHVERDADPAPCLNPGQLAALVELGRRVQAHYRAPQDTEWALDAAGQFWLTQARPITTLYPLPEAGLDGGTRIYFCASLAQGLTRPITPMGIATFRLIGASIAKLTGHPLSDPLAGPAVLHAPGQRLFVDLTGVLTHPLGRRMAIFALSVMEARSAAVLRTLAEDPRFAIRGNAATSLSGLGGAARLVLLRVKMPLRALTAATAPDAVPAVLDGLERRLRTELTLPADAAAEARLDLIEQRLASGFFAIMPTAFAYPATGLFLLRRAKQLLGDRARPEEFLTAVRGLPHNVTTEMDLRLWQMTQQIRADARSAAAFGALTTAELTEAYQRRELPAVAQRELTGFLRAYGQRAVAEIDLGMPRWSDDPSHIVGVVGNYLRLDDPDLAPDAQFERGRVEAEAMVDDLVDRLRDKPAKARIVRFALDRARQLVGFRESPKFLMITALGLIREHLAVVGRTLAERAAITDADDVFFLDFAEARRGLAGESLAALVADRRAAYAVELRRRHIPRLLLSDGTEPEALATRADLPADALAGSPASPGQVTGRARVVLDPVAARLEPGEILVAPSTDPGWTPLFLTAGGLVMEMGGSNSHGAVVAREYGIPAVVGVPDATIRITTGQTITVDGAAGLVTVVEQT